MARGQVAIYLLMLGVVVTVLALSLSPVVKEFADDARQPTNETANTIGLDCSNSSISDYQQAQCMVVDATLPYWFFVMLGIVGAILAARLYFGGSQ